VSDFGSWRSMVSQEDWTLYRDAGYGSRTRFGKRPCLLVIDVTNGFLGPRGRTAHEIAAEYPTACGRAGWDALPAIADLVHVFRTVRSPIIYTAGISDDPRAHAGRWMDKHPRTLEQREGAYNVVDEIRPQDEDFVLRKSKPSAFFGTPLLPLLIDLGVDTIVVAGCTTSGCVRAAVVDSFSYGFKNFIAEEAVFDRSQAAHVANLFDMDQKYGDVVDNQFVRSALEQCAPVQYEA
jgi:maleamate amidohydrolase